ncbi:MAG: hypothetical protein ACKV2O_18715 [Acidimicrobiales bacterium]
MDSSELTPGVQTFVGLHQAARIVGGWCWAEQRCFEVLGGWVRDTSDPAAKRLLAIHSRHHAWRAQRWAELLPRAYSASPEELSSSPGPVDQTVFEELDRLATVGRRMQGHYHEVYPALLRAYQTSPVVMSPLSDAPALRAIRIILSDGQHDLAEGRALISKLDRGISDPDHLTQLQQALAKTQVKAHESGHLATVFNRWGA